MHLGALAAKDLFPNFVSPACGPSLHTLRVMYSGHTHSTRRSDTHLECTSLRAAPVALPPQALPVWSGEKFGANFWIHQYDFRSAHASGCTMG